MTLIFSICNMTYKLDAILNHELMNTDAISIVHLRCRCVVIAYIFLYFSLHNAIFKMRIIIRRLRHCNLYTFCSWTENEVSVSSDVVSFGQSDIKQEDAGYIWFSLLCCCESLLQYLLSCVYLKIHRLFVGRICSGHLSCVRRSKHKVSYKILLRIVT